MDKIGNRIKELRKDTGITQMQLADWCKCSSQVISNIERGYTHPGTEIVNRIAECFRVSADYILGLSSSRWTADNSFSQGNSLSARIMRCMKKEKITLSDLSDISGIEFNDLDKIMDGSSKPNVDRLGALAKALNTTIDYLTGHTDFSLKILSEEEQDLIEYFRQASKSSKRIFLGEIERLMKE